MRELLQSHYKKALTVVAAGAFLWLFANQRQAFAPAVIQELSGETMNTRWHVQVVHGKGNDNLEQSAAAIAAALAHLDQGVFSGEATDSELSKLNATPVGKPALVSRELLEVLLLARTINRQSYGTFDITLAPLAKLWGKGAQPATGVPDDKAIAAAMKHLGADQYEVDARASTVTRTADITLDLSALAQGYAVDKVGELLQAAGYGNYRVEIGGAVRVQGWRQPEQSWLMAVEPPQAEPLEQKEQPQSEAPAALARVDNHGALIGVAGAAENRNLPTIDPHTGKPVDPALMAVTVLASTAAEAQAWAAAMRVLGPEAGPLLAEKRAMAVYFIIRKDAGVETRHSAAFEPYLLMAREVAP